MLPTLSSALQADLVGLEESHRLRACPPISGPDRSHATLGDQPVTSFCSNDYLGLANHPALAAAATAAIQRSGFGASASRLISGDFPEHRDLETALARFLATDAALLFPTGYQANLGAITALAGRGDLILSDEANHASLIDGCRLSRAEVVVYSHADLPAAATALAAASSSSYRRRFLVTESLFSMDGDVAPLAGLAALARDHDTALIVDEAHALGVLGPGGRGLCADAGVVPDVLIGTLGKAFGAHGGFVAGARELRATLVNRARTFIFTTAAPPPVVAAAHAALRLAAGAEGDARRRSLRERIDQLAAALPSPPAHRPTGPIVPVILGSDAAALAASNHLRQRAFFVQAIRPPTVAPGTSRLRITLSAAHPPDAVAALAAALTDLPPVP